MNLDLDFETIAAITVMLRDVPMIAPKQRDCLAEINRRWLEARCKAEQAELDANELIGPTALLRQRQAGVE